MPQHMPNSRKEVCTTIMRNNKVIKFAAIALLSAFALTACDDEIIAKPTGYDDNSPVVDLDKEVYNNNFFAINYKKLKNKNNLIDEFVLNINANSFND